MKANAGPLSPPSCTSMNSIVPNFRNILSNLLLFIDLGKFPTNILPSRYLSYTSLNDMACALKLRIVSSSCRRHKTKSLVQVPCLTMSPFSSENF